MFVTLFMDVEDLVAPEADDAAGECARILTEEGVEATFCVVGEKTRLLARRGRADVIEAMRLHDIGYHTNYHSVPPTVAQYLEPLDWESGVREAVRREGPGITSVTEVFGAVPSCWGGPGNTWGLQVCGAMAELGIPSFVYSHTRVPGGGVHRFAGRTAFPCGRHMNDGRYHDLAATAADRTRAAAEIAADVAAGIFWQELFMGHPSRILHEEFWDAPNFANGADTPPEKRIPARRKTKESYERALHSFRLAARHVRSLPGVELRTIREMNTILAGTPSRALSESERLSVWPAIATNLRGMSGWPILPRDFEPHNIAALTHERLGTLERMDFTGIAPRP